MKTIIIKKINGYDIIDGFDKPVIDPMATKVKAEKKYELTEEAKNVKQKSEEINRIAKVRNDLITQLKEHRKNGDTNKVAKTVYDLELRNIQIKTLCEELKELLKLKKEKDSVIWNESIVYFQPRPGEICVEDEIADSLGKKIIDNPGCVVDIEGNVIVNKVGVKYIKNGKIETVDRIGIEPDGPLVENVTADEFEIMRLDAMTESEKESEMNGIIDGLAWQASEMRSKLEIQGDSQALVKAQEWYRAEEQKVREKYFPGSTQE